MQAMSSSAVLRNARHEIKHWIEYDYVLVIEDFQTTFVQLKEILSAERALCPSGRFSHGKSKALIRNWQI